MMHYHDVREPAEALAYLLDCSLATVEDLATKKSRCKREYRRQISIAQKNYDWCVIFGSHLLSGRGEDVEACSGSVEQWVKGLEV